MKLRSALFAAIFAILIAPANSCPWLCNASDGGVPTSTFGCNQP